MSARMRWSGAALCLSLSLAGGAWAYDTYGFRWQNAHAHLQPVDVSFQAGSAATSDLAAAVRSWNQVSGSRFLFSSTSTSQGSRAFHHGDGQSGIAFTQQLGAGVLGVTYAEDYHGRRHAADVLFTTQANWAIGRAPQRSWEYDFRSVATHELGHALGLDHEDRWRCVMNRSSPPGRAEPLAEDDRNGARHLYPGASRHQPAAGAIDWAVRPGLTVHPRRVPSGGTISLTYRVDNAGRGPAPSSPVLEVYLSNDAAVTTQDTLVARDPVHIGPFPAGAGYATTQSIAVLFLPPGTYTLGALLDPHGQVPEAREDNNLASVSFEVLPPGGP